MRAAAENNRAMIVDLALRQNFFRNRWIDMYIFRIVLDAANDMDPLSENADGGPSVDLFWLLHADQIEKPKRRRHKKSKLVKSLFRSGR